MKSPHDGFAVAGSALKQRRCCPESTRAGHTGVLKEIWREKFQDKPRL
jgi:hypothetical protein